MQFSSQGPCSAWSQVTTCASCGSPQSHPGTVQNSPFTFLDDAGALVEAMGLAMLSTQLRIEYNMKIRVTLLLLKESKFGRGRGREVAVTNYRFGCKFSSVFLSEEF